MTKALLVIDIQESFRVRPLWAHIGNPNIVANVQRLVKTTRDAGDLVVWVLHSEAGSGGEFDPANGHVRLLDGLEAAAGEPVLHKTSHNAFTTTNLQQIFTERGIREVIVTGIRTEQCCETTARVASDLGYDVTFVTDATATFPIPHWEAGDDLDDPRTLSAADVVQRTEYALAGRFATIKSTDELGA
jgi:nicotinamidase-related amidase